MNLATTFVELRRHPRAQLKLPARVRWRGPLGMRMESTHTLDVSRGGLRVQRNEPCESGSRVWVVFPFDAASASVPGTYFPFTGTGDSGCHVPTSHTITVPAP